MSDQLKKLQEKRLELAAQIRAHADKLKPGATEQESGEWKSAWDKLNADYDANKTALEAENKRVEDAKAVSDRLSAIDSELSSSSRIGRDGGKVETGPQNLDLFTGGRESRYANQAIALHGWILNSQGQKNRLTDNHHAAAAAIGANLDGSEFVLNCFGTDELRRTRAQWQANPLNAMTAGQGSTGGYTIGQTLVGMLEKAMLDFSGVLQVADIIRTDNGEPLYWPTIDDTSNTGSRVGEGADAGTASDPSVGRVMWSAFDFTSGLLNVSRNLIVDSIFNMEEVIGGMLGERLGRKQNTDFTTGGGGGTAPRGIVSASALGVTAASATAIAYDEVIDLEHSVDPSRRNLPGVGYMMHDTIVQALRKLKDGEGRYLWQAGANSGTPDTLNARRFYINQSMASTMASGNKTLLFGQLSQYKVRQVGQVRLQRLVERRAEFNQDVFIAYMRADGNLLDAGDHPVKHLTH